MTQPLTTSALSQSQIEQIDWFIELPKCYSRESLFDSTFWSFVASRLNIRDNIRVWAEDNAFYMQLVVVDKGANWAKVVPIVEKIFDVQEVDTPEGYDIKWGGPVLKWRVLLNGQSILDRIASKSEAAEYAEKHKKNTTPPK